MRFAMMRNRYRFYAKWKNCSDCNPGPGVNGVNVFTVTFDRVAKSDVISAKSEDETLRLLYMDSGELRQIVQEAPIDMEPVYRLANLTINYDSLGRRNELIWGKPEHAGDAYDRQNRVVERTISDFVSTKYAYYKELRHPSTVELPGGSKYSLKYDTRGRLREIVTPSSESHHFAATPFGSGRVLKRRIPFTKKPFVAAEDSEGAIVGMDDGRRTSIMFFFNEMCDTGVTVFTYDADKLATVESSHLQVNLTYQGPLLVSMSERRQTKNGWRDSSFAVEHDELLRPTSIQAVISGTAVEPIQLIWGNRSTQVTYDRQNRVVERTISDFVSTKYAYYKELRHPSTVELPGFHFTKKPFVAAEDSEGRLLEWTTADELHHVLLQRDKYNRVVKEMCDTGVTVFTYDADKWRDSSFAVEHDELLRPTSIQAVISGTAVEPIQLAYDERTAFMSAYAGYQILRESTMMMHETSLDIYRQPVSVKIVIGDVRLSLMTVRDSAGRAIVSAWRTITGDFKETRSFDVQGRLASHEMNGKERWLFKYNNDSRVMLMNDVVCEWHAGGVPKKAGDVTFEMDGYGRLIGARGPSIDMKFDYDYQNRLISISNGATLYSLFYALPHLPRRVSHFQSSSDSSATSILYTEEGVPFAMSRDGFRYAVAVDDDGSLRYLLSESGIEKEIHRDPLGRVIADTQSKFWTPL
ncbi:hypothetical protein OSTOST_21985, partial [Ostertagia ostertagi]